MDYDELLATLTPEIVARLREAVQTGRWPDGRAVTAQQREHSLQAVIAWEARHLPQDQRVGYIDKGRKAAAAARSGPEALRWADKPGEDA